MENRSNKHESESDNDHWHSNIHCSLILLCSLLLIIAFRPSIQNTEKVSKIEVITENPQHSSNTESKTVVVKLGVDVSYYQGSIDWATTVQHIDFAILKATDGITYQDPKFVDNATILQGHKLPIGAYHFFEPDDDPVKQANNFISTVKPFKLAMRPIIDIEIAGGFSSKSISDKLKVLLATLESHFECKPIIYSYASYWDTNIGSSFNAYPFWLADYSPKPEPPESRKNFQLWQYSQSGHIDGINTAVDLDRFRGTQSEFKQLLCQANNKPRKD